MKKRLSCLLVAVLLLATLIPALPVLADGEAATEPTNTFNASDANPTISTVADYFAFFEAAFKTQTNFKGKTITLLHDIVFNDTTVADWYTQENLNKLDCSNTNWAWFEGIFEGGNHKLTGVIVEGSFRDGQAALFPHTRDASIKNLTVDGFYVCGTNTTTEPDYMGAGIGGLIGSGNRNVTVDNVTMTNGIVTSVKNGKGSLGALIGAYTFNNKVQLKITNSIVTNVQVVKGESNCELMGGIIGRFNATQDSDRSVLDFSGSVIQPTGSMDADVTLKPIGEARLQNNNDIAWFASNHANGYYSEDGTNRLWISMVQSKATIKKYSDNNTYADVTDVHNQAILKNGCYGATAIPTVKLVGAQPATDGSNDFRFVGLIKQVDLDLITELGFEITVGDKTVGADKIKCTKLYTSIKENGVDKSAPEGYYYFTFVVTDVADGTAFTVKACTTVDEKVCTTTAGSYTHTRAAS
ncbi:MAG TPA: hypothetical protein DDW30_08180 [Clostridiales bacterium]|nr:hypothetical protein [Clostridiales bacterium]